MSHDTEFCLISVESDYALLGRSMYILFTLCQE